MIVYMSVPTKEYSNRQYVGDIQEEIELCSNSTLLPSAGNKARKELIAVSDVMIMLPDWTTDADCCAERKYAESLEIPVYEYPSVPESKHLTEIRSPNQAQAFRELLGKMYRVHLQKNADYSPANIAGTGEVGLATRMWDKMARLMNLSGFNLEVKLLNFSQPKEPKNESIEDTLMDMAVYALINLLYRAGKWGN
jgi:hypothetical protein